MQAALPPNTQGSGVLPSFSSAWQLHSISTSCGFPGGVSSRISLNAQCSGTLGRCDAGLAVLLVEASDPDGARRRFTHAVDDAARDVRSSATAGLEELARRSAE